MYSVSKTFDIAYAHRLLLDYPSKCSNLHGHNGTISVNICTPKVNENGMVLDFTIFKEILDKTIISKYDHATLINIADEELFNFCKKMNSKFVVIFNNTTSENIAKSMWIDIATELKKLKKNRNITLPGLKEAILTIEFNESGNNLATFSDLICNPEINFESLEKNKKENVNKTINKRKVIINNMDENEEAFKIVRIYKID